MVISYHVQGQWSYFKYYSNTNNNANNNENE